MSLEKIDKLIRRLSESADHDVDWRRAEKEMALALRSLKDASNEMDAAEGNIYAPFDNMGSTLESLGDIIHNLSHQDDSLFDVGTNLKNIGMRLRKEWRDSVNRGRERRERAQAAQAKASPTPTSQATS